MKRVLGVWVVMLLCGTARGAEDPVQIEKAKPTVEYRTFDPKNKGNPPPPLKEDEEAVCTYHFGVASDVKYSYKPPRAGGGPVKVPVKVVGATVQLSLTITIWLPEGATDGLKAHEEGHRRLAEHYYQGAEASARALAAKVVGQSVTAEGKDAAAAAEAAADKLNRKLCDDYLQAITVPCNKAQAHYDLLTDHGQKAKPTVDEAIKESIEKAKER